MKTFRYLFSVFCMCGCIVCNASDVKIQSLEIGGEVFNNATVSYPGGATAKISHDDGVKSVKLDKLPQEVKDELGIGAEDEEFAKIAAEEEAVQSKIDEAKLKEIQEKRAKEKAQKDAELARAEEFRMVVYGHFEEGILCYGTFIETVYNRGYSSSMARVGGGGYGFGPSSFDRVVKDTSVKFYVTGVKNPKKFTKDKFIRFHGIMQDLKKVDAEIIPMVKLVKFILPPKKKEAEKPASRRSYSSDPFSKSPSRLASPKRAVGK